VGNPSLCPAFRVRRGRDREYGFAASRARRATRPTPEQISASSGDGADFSSRRVCWGITRRPLSPYARPHRCRSRGRAREPARESGGTPTGATAGAGERRGQRKAAPTRAMPRQGTPDQAREPRFPGVKRPRIRSATPDPRRPSHPSTRRILLNILIVPS
jgi:hypothetical protein